MNLPALFAIVQDFASWGKSKFVGVWLLGEDIGKAVAGATSGVTADPGLVSRLDEGLFNLSIIAPGNLFNNCADVRLS